MDELEADLKAEMDALNEKLSNADAVAEAARRKALFDARAAIDDDAADALEAMALIVENAKLMLDLGKTLDNAIKELKKAEPAADAMKNAETAMSDFLNAAVTKNAYEVKFAESSALVEEYAELVINAHDASAEVKKAAEDTLKAIADAEKAAIATVNQADITYTAATRKCDAAGIAYTIPDALVIPEETEDSIVTEDEEETTETETEEEEDIKNIEEVEEYNYTKYTDDTGSIVAVTYGGKNGNDMEAFKTFILNYNSFSVEVVFEGTTYTIPAFSLVVIYR